MSFAVYLKSNSGELGQCRRIDAETRHLIQSMLTQGDWRDGLIASLAAEIAGIPLCEIAEGLGCHVADEKLFVRCIGIEYTIDQHGKVEPEPKNKWITVLLLHYIRNKGRGEFTHSWIAFQDLKSGMFKAASFTRECERPLRELIDEDGEAAATILRGLGAAPVKGFSSDLAVSMDLLPKVRILVLYQNSTEEFPSSLKILFDGITDAFLDVESVMFLCEGLVHTLRAMKRV